MNYLRRLVARLWSYLGNHFTSLRRKRRRRRYYPIQRALFIPTVPALTSLESRELPFPLINPMSGLEFLGLDVLGSPPSVSFADVSITGGRETPESVAGRPDDSETFPDPTPRSDGASDAPSEPTGSDLEAANRVFEELASNSNADLHLPILDEPSSSPPAQPTTPPSVGASSPATGSGGGIPSAPTLPTGGTTPQPTLGRGGEAAAPVPPTSGTVVPPSSKLQRRDDGWDDGIDPRRAAGQLHNQPAGHTCIGQFHTAANAYTTQVTITSFEQGIWSR
jgi:hypothetical protein